MNIIDCFGYLHLYSRNVKVKREGRWREREKGKDERERREYIGGMERGGSRRDKGKRESRIISEFVTMYNLHA